MDEDIKLKHGRGGHYYEWRCPINHCPYVVWDSFRVVVRIRRWLHITMKV